MPQNVVCAVDKAGSFWYNWLHRFVGDYRSEALSLDEASGFMGGVIMFSSVYSMENRISLTFRCAGSYSLSQMKETTLEMLPFEMFLYAKRGAFRLSDGGAPILCREGETVFIPCDLSCTITPESENAEVLFVGADFRVYTSLRIFSLYELPRLMASEKVGELCLGICRLAEDNEFTNSRMDNAVLVNSYLYELAREMILLGTPFSAGSVVEQYKKLSPVLTHIGDSMGHPIAIEELSGMISMTEDTFYRLFRSATGEAPRDYLLAERFRHARILLLQTDEPISTVSEHCGYESPFSFSTLFRARFGVSPSAYRYSMKMIL